MPNGPDINHDLLRIEAEIQRLFHQIRLRASIEEANLLFGTLSEIQFVLSKLVFKEGKRVTSTLRKFVRDFERIDVDSIRADLFTRIKTGEYNCK